MSSAVYGESSLEDVYPDVEAFYSITVLDYEFTDSFETY